MLDQATKRPSDQANLPFPPLDLLQRTGNVGEENPQQSYDDIGNAIRAHIESMLPADWSWTGIRVLDFGCGAGRVLRQFQREATGSEFWGCDIDRPSVAWINANLSPAFRAVECDETPGLSLPDQHFNLIYSISVFTHLTDHSAGWLLELHRTLAPGGLLLASFLGEAMTEQLLNEPWQEDRIGFNAVLHGNPWDQGGPLTFLSPWWIRAHWGRAFEIVDLRAATAYDPQTGKPQGHGLVLLRKRDVRLTAEDIDRIEVGESREITALRHNVKQLADEIRTLRAHLAAVETREQSRSG